MAALGPGEVDPAWWVVMDNLLSESLELPRLADLPDRSESIGFYERARGRAAEHIDYYEIFAALRFALVLIRATERYPSALSPPTRHSDRTAHRCGCSRSSSAWQSPS
jgi:aminoglycoside phosphotransferase (APT) family kinase protein